ncbi:putative amino acid-binding periplasmic protein [Fulvimarina pelagi HTCC2506]|uniref:Putative amino acid-binding periplasmic protein n=3 Tax=Fulvimarina pelagi TaxID=217511 RepID=Q0G1C0_9HYPH|nr:branched-chain amino acid ABC transporter substrate-binding protein [Fulvimarina pelagi]EAU41161.1 putative amino acid-binding periplasmic protein [Fulvimarina pelagi HTCC2506]BAT30825.1 putative amino acid-binding periplasmic protein [Fulvimarina pelagi]
MPVLRIAALFGYALLLSAPAFAQEQPVIGVSAPLSGSSALLGQQIVNGAQEAGSGVATIAPADTECTPEGGEVAARSYVEEEARIVVGFLCTESLLAALPILTEAGIPVIDVGVRANRVTDDREDTGHLVWRLAPRSDAEARAIAETISKRWRNEPFGLIEDGSIANRGLVDTVRRLVAEEGLEPAATDNYRPAEEKQFGLVRRLARTGVTRFFIAGDRPDIAVIARDAAELDLDLQIIGGESLLDETSVDQPLPEGIVALAPPYSYAPPEADGVEDIALSGYGGVAHAAVEIAVRALELAEGSTRSLAEILNEESFETLLGTVAFDEKGDARAVAYRPLRWSGSEFIFDAEAAGQ